MKIADLKTMADLSVHENFIKVEFGLEGVHYAEEYFQKLFDENGMADKYSDDDIFYGFPVRLFLIDGEKRRDISVTACVIPQFPGKVFYYWWFN